MRQTLVACLVVLALALSCAAHAAFADSQDLAAGHAQLTTQAAAAGISYETHVQNVGWQSAVANGSTAGTTGRSLRVEALRLRLSGVDGGITYCAHVQNVGWQDYVGEGITCGTTGRGLRVEALRISLTGDIANHYDIYYRTHVADYGWLDWAKNGATAGSEGQCGA